MTGQSPATSTPDRPPLVPGWFLAIAASFMIVNMLVRGADLLIPVAVAILVFILFSAITDNIARVSLGGVSAPGWLTHLLAIVLILSGFAVVFSILSSQAGQVSEAIPRYADRLETMTAGLVEWLGQDRVQSISKHLSDINLGATFAGILGSAGTMLTGLSLVVLYCAFMIAERSLLEQKIAALFPGRHDVRSMVKAIAEHVRLYVWVKTLMSVMTGGFAYIVMKAIGVDFAETWGLLVFLLNYIPNVGSILGTIFPAVLALVQFDTITPFLVVAVGIGAAQLVIGNVLEPMMMGRSLNLSSFIIILSLTFWGTVWGIAGMFLSVPIMVVIMIACSHIEGLRWLAILLSGDVTAFVEDGQTG